MAARALGIRLIAKRSPFQIAGLATEKHGTA